MTAVAAETKTMTVMAALNEALDECLAEDERVFLLGEDLAEGNVVGMTNGLSEKYGRNRVLNTPISEAAILGAAIGAAIDGQIPVPEIMIMDFITIAMDQMINLAAKARAMSAGRTGCPITVRTATFGGTGNGATHSQSLEGWFTHMPGLKVVMPSTAADAKGLLKASIFDPDPVLFVETTACYGIRGEVPVGDHRVELGKADTKRVGSDVTLIAHGRAVFDSLAAAEQLAGEGIDVEVLDLRTLMPLDVETIFASVARTGRAVITHYALQHAGPGAEVAAQISTELFRELRAPVVRVGTRFRPIPASVPLEFQIYPNADKIAAAVRSTVGYSR